MLLINRLLQNGAPLGRTTLLPFAELKLPKVALNYDELVGALLEDRLIEGNAETFILTSLGEQRLAAVASEYSLHAWFYNEYYEAIRISRAHSLLCERVYGKDLGQHGMADMEQVHSALSALGVSSGMSLLDFGCGDGQITEYIADTTGADVTGVDIAGEAIRSWLRYELQESVTGCTYTAPTWKLRRRLSQTCISTASWRSTACFSPVTSRS